MNDAWEALKEWLYRHDRSFDEITVWAIALGWTVWSLSKVPPLFALWGARDRTAIGRTMRPQKASEMVAGLSIASLYWLTLIAYYAEWMPTFWTRLALRMVLTVSILAAVWFGLRFDRAVLATTTATTDRQDAREARQDRREIRQDARQTAQDARDEPRERSP